MHGSRSANPDVPPTNGCGERWGLSAVPSSGRAPHRCAARRSRRVTIRLGRSRGGRSPFANANHWLRQIGAIGSATTRWPGRRCRLPGSCLIFHRSRRPYRSGRPSLDGRTRRGRSRDRARITSRASRGRARHHGQGEPAAARDQRLAVGARCRARGPARPTPARSGRVLSREPPLLRVSASHRSPEPCRPPRRPRRPGLRLWRAILSTSEAVSSRDAQPRRP
jgi:hypothetical protein